MVFRGYQIAIEINDCDIIPKISEDIKGLLRSNSEVFLDKEASLLLFVSDRKFFCRIDSRMQSQKHCYLNYFNQLWSSTLKILEEKHLLLRRLMSWIKMLVKCC
ncbi:hypothetical protein Ddye_017739 [Dipteronia dyeriana]|uniref:Uncharacterized protein n=1 Tax=Dipteronia dyeriana TaxID=168575 RepID=A0AAD9X1N8_9ROSI|nr:hypothetical protein Ddye_017739 [Dipteronia dyeriana]